MKNRQPEDASSLREASFQEKLPNNEVRCLLCSHRCVVADGRRGLCGVRENRAGTLYSLVYNRPISEHVDPIEKKPLYHFHPGSEAYSIAAPGCNFRCHWCQNWEISQPPREERFSSAGCGRLPAQVAAAARESGCLSIAYTYTEPTVFFEYAEETALLARALGLANLFVTNGFMTSEMLSAFHPLLDAANVDLKAFRDETYRRYTGGRLGPVLDNMKLMKKLGIWLEVTTLVIPGINDDEDELRDAARFVARELCPETPWHLSRFFPNYKMTDRPPTPLHTLERARDIGRNEGLHYVYIGNIGDGNDTFCHACGKTLIRRRGFFIAENHIRAGCCPACRTPAAGVGMDGTSPP